MAINFKVLDIIKNGKFSHIHIVSNQDGIQFGLVDKNKFISKIEYICNCIKDYCNIENCTYDFCEVNNKHDKRRKPNCGMLDKFIELNNYNKDNCIMIGNASGLPGQFSNSDKKCAEYFGCEYYDVNEFINMFCNSQTKQI